MYILYTVKRKKVLTMEDFEVIDVVETNEPHINPKPKKSNKGLKQLFIGLGVVGLGFGGGIGGAYLYDTMNDNSGTTIVQSSAEPVSKKTDSGLTYAQIAEKAADSVVAIQTESKATGTFMQDYVTEGAGSGVIISEDGYIVTNHHVINGANKVSVTLKNGKTYNAKYIGSDEQSDLAVIKIEAEELSPATLGDSDKLSVGDSAVAIGNPLGTLGGTVTTGIISALDRELTIEGETMTLMQTNAAINPGNSGGGLFDSNGNLVGIVNAKSSGEDIEGLGFAIPVNDAKVVIEELIQNGYVSSRAKLGVSMVDIADEMSALRYGVGELGVYIAQVEKNSAASKADLKIGDRILSINGTEIKTSSDARKIIHEHKAGDQITITIERDNKQQDVLITLGESKNIDQNDF